MAASFEHPVTLWIRWWLWEEDEQQLGGAGRAEEVVGADLGEKKQLMLG